MSFLIYFYDSALHTIFIINKYPMFINIIYLDDFIDKIYLVNSSIYTCWISPRVTFFINVIIYCWQTFLIVHFLVCNITIFIRHQIPLVINITYCQQPERVCIVSHALAIHSRNYHSWLFIFIYKVSFYLISFFVKDRIITMVSVQMSCSSFFLIIIDIVSDFNRIVIFIELCLNNTVAVKRNNRLSRIIQISSLYFSHVFIIINMNTTIAP